MELAPIQARSVLICHHDDPLNRFGLSRWLSSFTYLTAVIVVCEPKARLCRRINREVKRIGLLRFLDVLAFRLYSHFMLADGERCWTQETLRKLEARYPPVSAETRILMSPSPNSAEAEQALKEAAPDIILARCKNILNERIFSLARLGTFVMHPGICPEYRNAHGCFWALAMDDRANVGMTLLKADAGVDTGQIYGYYRYDFDSVHESHTIIQNRVVLDNLDRLQEKFEEILAGTAATIDTTGHRSRAWGQPWLTAYWRWKKLARESK